jgi:hypothetical protein
MDNVTNDLKTLFDEAKQRSEFDFVLTLMNYRGMGTHKWMTNLYEWFDAIEFYKKLYQGHTGKEKTRIAALIYSTFFENSDFYNIVGSLCKVKTGYKGSSYLFWKTKKYERLLGIGEKQDSILELLHDAGKSNIIDFFKQNHFKEIRNTFFHSVYALSEDEYILHDTEPIHIEGLGQTSFNVNTFFYPKVDNVIIFFDKFKDLYLSEFASYTVDKVVKGYFPNLCDITIMGATDGLKGFRIKNSVQFNGQWHDSGIWYDEQYDIYAGHNITLNMPNIETIEIDDQLKRYENKDDIHQSDVEFHNLIEKISDRKQPSEIARATNLLLKFGDLRHKKMEQEQNHFKKRSFPKFILPFYKKAIEIGSPLFETTPIKKVIDELEKSIM